MTGEPAADPEPVGERPAAPAWRRPWVVGLAVGLVVLAAVVVVARPRPQDDYDDAVRDRFVGACTADGGDGVRATCECLYERLRVEVPFDRFELIDQTLAIQVQGSPGAPLTLPVDVQAMLDGCIAGTG